MLKHCQCRPKRERSDDDMNDLPSTNDKNQKENDTTGDRMTVTEVVDMTKISSNKPEQYTETPTRILKIVQIDKGQKTRFTLNMEKGGGGGGGGGDLKLAQTQYSVPDSVLFELINANSTVTPYLVEGRSTYFIDRDPKLFPVIPNYIRKGGRYHSDMLPRDIRQSKELQVEAAFCELLELNIQHRISDLQHGHVLLENNFFGGVVYYSLTLMVF